MPGACTHACHKRWMAAGSLIEAALGGGRAGACMLLAVFFMQSLSKHERMHLCPMHARLWEGQRQAAECPRQACTALELMFMQGLCRGAASKEPGVSPGAEPTAGAQRLCGHGHAAPGRPAQAAAGQRQPGNRGRTCSGEASTAQLPLPGTARWRAPHRCAWCGRAASKSWLVWHAVCQQAHQRLLLPHSHACNAYQVRCTVGCAGSR